MNRFYLLICFLFFGFSSLSQEEIFEDSLPDPDPRYMTTEYEMIILDGDTVLRNNVTKELYNKSFRKVGANVPTIKTDWLNLDWDIKEFNPYKDDKIIWPLVINFSNERFTMPIEGVVTSRYGWRRGRAHRGIDLDLVTGDNIKVVMDGKVRFAKYYGGFGNCVVVRHNNGLETIYAHMSKILVKPNDYVYSGQVIGKGGNTGRSYGSHLHFEARYKNHAIHPEYLFDFEGTKNFTAPQVVVTDFWLDARKHRSYKKSKINVRNQTLYSQNNSTNFKKTEVNPENSLTKSSQSQGLKKDQNLSTVLRKEQEIFHKVERGETLAIIAKQYSLTVTQLCELNNINKSAVLKVGQQLKVN